MKVISRNRIVVIGPSDKQAAETYLYAAGPNVNDAKSNSSANNKLGGGAGEPSTAEKQKRAKNGQGWDKAKKAWVSIQAGAEKYGLVDALLGKIGLGNQSGGPAPVGTGNNNPPPQGDSSKDAKSPMDNTTKIILVSVGVVILAGVVYAIVKKSK